MDFTPHITTARVTLTTTIFHENWWLDAVAPGKWAEVTVLDQGEVVARLPYVVKSSRFLKALGMPSMTHTLGPQLPLPGMRSHAGRAFDERALIQGLMAQLPPHNYFSQICDPSLENSLPFYMLGYDSSLTYTLRIPAGTSPEQIWSGIRKRLRSSIRQAEREYTIDRDLGIEEFCDFFNTCVKTNHKVFWSKEFQSRADEIKTRAFHACRAHDAGCILAVRDDAHVVRAAVMLVWGHGVMYYLLTVRHPDAETSYHASKLLIWESLKLAAAKQLTFDFDGFPRPEAVNLLGGFGGQLCQRITISKIPPMVLLAQAIKSRTKFAF